MSARLTVVLDDEELYRQLKVKAAQDGVSMKDLVEEGLRSVLAAPSRPNVGPPAEASSKQFDWKHYDELMKRWEEEDRNLGVEADHPTDLSDVKHHLYGHPKQAGPSGRRILRVAEEHSAYDAD